MLRLESLRDSGKTVVLLHGRDKETVEALVSSLRSLAADLVAEVPIHEMPGVNSIGGCQVVATNRSGRPGIWAESVPGVYRWSQDSEGWLQAAELAEPVGRAAAESGARFQFLEAQGSATLILSTERSW
jgi:hypothetical protein